WHGLPAVAIVDDPLAGEAIQVDGNLYQRTSGLWVWSQLLVLGGTLLLSGPALLYALLWLPLTLVRGRVGNPSAQFQIWPVLSSALLISIVLLAVFSTSDITAFKPWSLLSVGMLALTLAYALSTTWSLALLYRVRNARVRPC